MKTYKVSINASVIVKAESMGEAAEYLKEVIWHQRPNFDVEEATKEEVDNYKRNTPWGKVPTYHPGDDMEYEFYQV